MFQDYRCARFFSWQVFASTHTHQLHLAVQERWEENKVGALMVYLHKKRVGKKATKIKNILLFYVS